MLSLNARLYNGQDSKSEVVTIIRCDAEKLVILNSEGVSRTYEARELIIPSQIGKTSPMIRLPSGASLTLEYSKETMALIKILRGHRKDWLHYIESRWQLVLGCGVGAVFAGLIIFFWGIPATARVAQPHVPYEFKELVGGQIVELLNASFFKEPTASEEYLNERTALARSLFEGEEYKDFKFFVKGTSQPMRNAMAILPSTIVLTEDLVTSLSPEELMAITAHEIGHLAHDHGTQKLLQNSLLSTVGASIMGVSILSPDALQILAFALIFSNYSRGHEKEADLFAAELLHEKGFSVEYLISALKKTVCDSDECEVNETGFFEKYASTHPGLKERLELIADFRELNTSP